GFTKIEGTKTEGPAQKLREAPGERATATRARSRSSTRLLLRRQGVLDPVLREVRVDTRLGRPGVAGVVALGVDADVLLLAVLVLDERIAAGVAIARSARPDHVAHQPVRPDLVDERTADAPRPVVERVGSSRTVTDHAVLLVVVAVMDVVERTDLGE